jgi:ELWxxDGT repeat protein
MLAQAALAHRRSSWLLIALLLALMPLLVVPQAVTAAPQTTLLKDINPGAGSSDPELNVVWNGHAYFQVASPGPSDALWRTDGTPQGTTLVKDFSSSTGVNGKINSPIVIFKGALYFVVAFFGGSAANAQLWKSDGTPAGTVLIKDVGIVTDGVEFPELVGSNDLLYFQTAANGSTAGLLWQSDGTAAGTVLLLGPTIPKYYSLLKTGTNFFAFVITNSATNGNTEVVRRDGASGALTTIYSAPSSEVYINEMYPVGNDLYFTVYPRQPNNQGVEIRVNRSANTTSSLVKRLSRDSTDDDFVTAIGFAGRLFFSTSKGDPEDPRGYLDNSLWATDGTEAGTVRLYIEPGGSFEAGFQLYPLNGQLYFTRAYGIGVSDGTVAGTRELVDVERPAFLVWFDNQVYFLKAINDRELESYRAVLWRTDGTQLGTRPVVTNLVFNASDRPLVPLGATLLLNANDGSRGDELWKLFDDGAPASRVTDGLLALYEFEEGSGNTIRDTSGVGTALDLRVARAFNHQWVDGGLRLRGGTVLRSRGAATKINQAAIDNDVLTVEAWVKPDNVAQFSSRIVTISPNATVRNITLTQGSFDRNNPSEAIVRYRQSTGPSSGTELSSGPGVMNNQLVHVVFVIGQESGQMAVWLYVNGVEVGKRVHSSGTLNTWNNSYPLLLGNEALGGRGWKGTYYLVAFYNRALNAAEVEQNYNVGP